MVLVCLICLFLVWLDGLLVSVCVLALFVCKNPLSTRRLVVCLLIGCFVFWVLNFIVLFRLFVSLFCIVCLLVGLFDCWFVCLFVCLRVAALLLLLFFGVCALLFGFGCLFVCLFVCLCLPLLFVCVCLCLCA